MSLIRLAVASCLLLGAAIAAPAGAAVRLDELRVPPGFRVELLTDQVPNARQMALGRFEGGKGVVYVGSMREGKVYAVEIDAGKARAVHTIASDLEIPSGVAWRDGKLYVGALSRILRFDGIDGRLAHPPAPVVVTDKLPDDKHHGARFLAFGPD